MEVLTIVLSSLLSLVSGGGIVVDSVVANQVRSQLVDVEQQAVRIDNSPSYQIAQGKLQKVRIATRGAIVKPDLRIEAIELETDRVDINLAKLNTESIDTLRESLDRPFQGAIRLAIAEADLNRTLKSPEVLAQIQDALNRVIVSKAGSTNISYQLLELQLQLRPGNRLGTKLSLARPNSRFESQSNFNDSNGTDTRKLTLEIELGIEVNRGKTIRLVDPRGTVNDRPMSPRLLNGFAEGISDRLNLGLLEEDGILARILQLEIDEDRLELASFFKLETKSLSSSSEDIEAVP